MTHYKKLIEHLFNTEKNVEKYQRIIKVLEEAVEHFQEHQTESFMELKQDIHELIHGEKFDEHFAKITVCEMYHICSEKGKVVGEVVSIGNTREYIKRYGLSGINDWDAYVAFNANYHDKKNLFKKWHTENFEEKIIEDAIEFYFKDDDAPDNKVWKVLSSY